MTRLHLKLMGSVLLSAVVAGAGSVGAQTDTAVEYYHAEYGHYFVTAIQAEIDALDQGEFTGWARTGETFGVLPLDTANAANVCRFWSGQTFVPKSSHFYTPFASECEIVKGNPDWAFEGHVFGMKLPNEAGICDVSSIPLYRLYNDGMSGAPNHRYTIRWDVFLAMRAAGWVPEGHGNTFAFACVPTLSLPPITSAEGIWGGPTNIPDTMFIGAVLENSDTWITILSTEMGLSVGFFRGTVNSSAGELAGQLSGYFLGQPDFSATVAGYYSPREEMAATLDGVMLTGGYAPFYDQAATSLVTAGKWKLLGMDLHGAQLDADLVLEISAAGTLTGSSPTGCQVSGTLLPRPSGKNIYDLSISTGGAGCALGSSTSKGVVIILVVAPDEEMALIGMTVSTNPSNGYVWQGMRAFD